MLKVKSGYELPKLTDMSKTAQTTTQSVPVIFWQDKKRQGARDLAQHIYIPLQPGNPKVFSPSAQMMYAARPEFRRVLRLPACVTDPYRTM